MLVAVAVAVARSPGLRATATATPALPVTSIPYPEVPRLSVAEDKAHYDAGTALFVDVRSAEAFSRGHIARAISLPLSELEWRYKELPRDATIVTVCT